jgi:hypothetical protein
MKRFYAPFPLMESPQGEWIRLEDHEAIIRRQASAARSGMDAAKTISNHQLETARRLKAESSPDALESERQANAKLTQELSLAEEGLANATQELERVKSQANVKIEQLRVDYERLRKAIEDHQTAVCDNPQAAGIFADELLWAVLEPVPQSAPHAAEQNAHRSTVTFDPQSN